MRKIITIFILFTISKCTSIKSEFKELSILNKYTSEENIEIKIHESYNEKIVTIFKKHKKENQKVTLYFDRTSFLGFQNKNKVILDSLNNIKSKNVSYYLIDKFRVAGYEIVIYPYNYNKFIKFISTISLGLIPTTDEFELVLELSVSNIENITKTKIAKSSSVIYLHNGIDYSRFKPLHEYKDEGIMQAYEILAQYILN